MIEGLLWGSLLLLAYTYAGYPVLIAAWAAFRPNPPRRGAVEPTVSVVVVAHDEAAQVAARLENLLALHYPAERREIVLASDGSTDDTVAIARGFEAAGVVVRAFPDRRGKAAVLNEVVPQAKGEVVVLGDCRQRFEPAALRALVGCFADPAVGAVSGELVLAGDESGVGEGVGFYWRYEKFLRIRESCVDSTVGATGAIYAIRKQGFEPIPPDTLLDDVLIPMRIVRQGQRSIFERAAVAHDRVSTRAEEEFTRKVRTIAGNFQLFAHHPWLLSPARNRLWLQTWSHKVLRLVSPMLLFVALAASAARIDQPAGRWSFTLQVSFYAVAALGWGLGRSRSRVPLLGIPYVFCLLNWTTVVAFWRFVTRRQRVTWARSVLPPDLPPTEPTRGGESKPSVSGEAR